MESTRSYFIDFPGKINYFLSKSVWERSFGKHKSHPVKHTRMANLETLSDAFEK